MSLNDLSNEVWKIIFSYLQEPDEDIYYRLVPGFQPPSYHGSLISVPLDIQREINVKTIYPVLLVSKHCHAAALSYMWYRMTMITDEEGVAASESFTQTVFGKSNIGEAVLLRSSLYLWPNSLEKVTHYYASNKHAYLINYDSPCIEINAFCLASPRYMPNLKKLVANFLPFPDLTISDSLLPATHYKELILELTVGCVQLLDLFSGNAKKIFQFVTILCVKLFGPAYQVLDPILEMPLLKELSLRGKSHSNTFLTTLLGGNPKLEMLDTGLFGGKAVYEYNGIGRNLVELTCRDLVLDQMIEQRQSFPKIKRLSLVVCLPTFLFQTTHMPFHNLEEFVCSNRNGQRYEVVHDMIIYVLRHNPMLKSMTLSHSSSTLWQDSLDSEDDLIFPTIQHVRVLNAIKSLEKSFKLGVLAGFFPKCQTMEVPCTKMSSIDPSGLMRIASVNTKLAYIVIRCKIYYHSKRRSFPGSLFSADRLSALNFCFPLVPNADGKNCEKYLVPLTSSDSSPWTKVKRSYVIDISKMKKFFDVDVGSDAIELGYLMIR